MEDFANYSDFVHLVLFKILIQTIQVSVRNLDCGDLETDYLLKVHLCFARA